MKKVIPGTCILITILAGGTLASTENDRQTVPLPPDVGFPIAVVVDPAGNTLLFKHELESVAIVPGIPSPTGGQVQINEVTTLPTPANVVLSGPWDLDDDLKREFLIGEVLPGILGSRFEFFESSADDAFQSVHLIESLGDDVALFPSDVGDSDGDSLAEFTIYGRIGNDFFVRLYESASLGAYPTEIAWQFDGEWMENMAKIEDTDGDGVQEIVIGGRDLTGVRVVIFENDGDNTFTQTLYDPIPELTSPQAMTVTNDLDGDGRVEILVGGLDGGWVYALESTGNDTYQQVWGEQILPGSVLNVATIVDAGDLDGDGKKEFIAGGLKPVSGPSDPFYSVLQLFEAVSDNEFDVVASFWIPIGLDGTDAAVADVDGDGKLEIVHAIERTGVTIYRNTGDNTWEEMWTTTNLNFDMNEIGAGDYDRDGKDELILPEVDFTGIYEIDHADAADPDGDGLVDVIDNCPATWNPGQEDADRDDVGDFCDNCLHGPNPGQGPAPLGQDLRAQDADTFCWDTPADVDHVRGDLAAVGAYATDRSGSAALATCLVDSWTPSAGTGVYYLARPDCGVGSWQTTPGAEPGRDAALP